MRRFGSLIVSIASAVAISCSPDVTNQNPVDNPEIPVANNYVPEAFLSNIIHLDSASRSVDLSVTCLGVDYDAAGNMVVALDGADPVTSSVGEDSISAFYDTNFAHQTFDQSGVSNCVVSSQEDSATANAFFDIPKRDYFPTKIDTSWEFVRAENNSLKLKATSTVTDLDKPAFAILMGYHSVSGGLEKRGPLPAPADLISEFVFSDFFNFQYHPTDTISRTISVDSYTHWISSDFIKHNSVYTSDSVLVPIPPDLNPTRLTPWGTLFGAGGFVPNTRDMITRCIISDSDQWYHRLISPSGKISDFKHSGRDTTIVDTIPIAPVDTTANILCRSINHGSIFKDSLMFNVPGNLYSPIISHFPSSQGSTSHICEATDYDRGGFTIRVHQTGTRPQADSVFVEPGIEFGRVTHTPGVFQIDEGTVCLVTDNLGNRVITDTLFYAQ